MILEQLSVHDEAERLRLQIEAAVGVAGGGATKYATGRDKDAPLGNSGGSDDGKGKGCYGDCTEDYLLHVRLQSEMYCWPSLHQLLELLRWEVWVPYKEQSVDLGGQGLRGLGWVDWYLLVRLRVVVT